VGKSIAEPHFQQDQKWFDLFSKAVKSDWLLTLPKVCFCFWSPKIMKYIFIKAFIPWYLFEIRVLFISQHLSRKQSPLHILGNPIILISLPAKRDEFPKKKLQPTCNKQHSRTFPTYWQLRSVNFSMVTCERFPENRCLTSWLFWDRPQRHFRWRPTQNRRAALSMRSAKNKKVKQKHPESSLSRNCP